MSGGETQEPLAPCPRPLQCPGLLVSQKSLQAPWHWKEAQQPHPLQSSDLRLSWLAWSTDTVNHPVSVVLRRWCWGRSLAADMPGHVLFLQDTPPPSFPPFQKSSSHCQEPLAEEPT